MALQHPGDADRIDPDGGVVHSQAPPEPAPEPQVQTVPVDPRTVSAAKSGVFPRRPAEAFQSPEPGTFSPALMDSLRRNTPGWSDDNADVLEYTLRSVYPDMPGAMMSDVQKMVMENADPSLLQESSAKLQRLVGLNTKDMFDEASLKRMLGVADEDEVFANAAIDTFLETGGAVRTAATVFQNTQNQRTWFTDLWMENDERRRSIEKEVTRETGDPSVTRINGLRGKSASWVVDGNELAMTWEDVESGTTADVLIFLEEGTKVETSADAVTEYLIATHGNRHIISPTSDEVQGRQSWLGALFEGADDVVLAVERWGTSRFQSGISEDVVRAVVQTGALEVFADDSQAEAAHDSAMEQQRRATVERNLQDTQILAVMQDYQRINPDAAMSDVVTAGIGAWNELPDDEKKATVAQTVQDLEAAAEQKRREQSFLGEIIEEDIAPPVYSALAAWENAIQFIGVATLDLTNLDSGREILQRVQEEGLSGLMDPRNVEALLNPLGIDSETFMREFENVRTEGYPKAVAAYAESIADIGTVADYYGIDPESNAAAWVNGFASVAFDPLTYATLGGNASWNALKKGVTTTAGAERLVMSRPIRSAAKNIVVNNRVSTVPLLAAGGLSDDAVVRLADIAATNYVGKEARVEAMSQVIDVLRHELPAYGGMWIPQGPARVLARKTTTGLAELSKLAGTDTKARGFLQDVLLRASANRFVRINDRNWLDEMFSMFQVRRLNDTSGFADDISRAVNARRAYAEGDATATMLQGRGQVLRQELEDLTSMADEVGQVPKLRDRVAEWNGSVKELDRLIEGTADDAARSTLEARRAAAIEARDASQALADETGHLFDARVKSVAQRRKELTQIEAQLAELDGVARDRSLLEQFTHTYLDEWADEVGVPVVLGADGNPVPHPWFPNLPLRDWSKVTGKNGTVSRIDEAAKVLEPFGEDAAALQALGVNARRGTTPLPISPHELLAYQTMQRNAATRAVWNTMTGTRFGRGVKATLDGVQTAFASAVLWNFKTAFRSNIDEVVRFYEDAGGSVDVLKTATTARGSVGPEARAFYRDLDGLFASGNADWQMIDVSKRGMWQHAERWVNGTLGNDPVMKAFARAWQAGGDEATRRAVWEEWFNETGIKLVKRSTINSTEITAGNSFDVLNRSLNGWLGQVADEGRRAKFFDDMMEAFASGKSVPWEPKDYRHLPPVPGQVSTQTGTGFRHVMDNVFRVGYGAPQQRRGSVFFDHHFEWAKQMYDEAYAGKIIDEDWLIRNGYADDMLHAQELLAGGRRSQPIRDAMTKGGMVLEEDLHNNAIRWAGTVADDMMYTFGAVSIFGKKAARVYPFGRAQTDYLQWWWKKATQPTNTPWGQINAPVNLRLIDRMGHLANLGNPELNSSYEQPGALSPAGIINNFTFLPTQLSEQTLIDVSPSAGPIASWVAEAPWAPDGLRDALYEFHPGNRQYAQTYTSNWDWGKGLYDAIFPSGGFTVRNQLEKAQQAAYWVAAWQMLDYDPELPVSDDQQRRLNATFNNLVINSAAGPYRNDRVKIDHAEWLSDNAHNAIPDLSDPESDIMREWGLRNEAASFAALGESVTDFGLKIAGTPSTGGSDFQYVESLLPVADYVDGWVDSGSIADAKRDAIKLGIELIESGKATARDRLSFADEVLESVFELLTDEEKTEFIANNPEVAINMVSSYEVNPSLVPDDVEGGVVGDRIRTSNLTLARELRERGRKEGWLTARGDNEIRHDALVSAQRSFREYLDIIYKRGTGLDISQQTTEFGDDNERVNISKLQVGIDSDWYFQHRQFFEASGNVDLPAEAVAAWTSGEEYKMNMGEFRSMVLDAKSKYAYEFQMSSAVESKLNRIGINSRDNTVLGRRAMSIHGIDGDPEDLAHYGSRLYEDFNAAVSAGQKYHQWADLTEWDVDEFFVEEVDKDGEVVRTTFSKKDLLARARTAVAISAMQKDGRGNNFDQFTEKDYDNSVLGRNLGPLDWEPPQPPPLDETKGYFTANTDELIVLDGDTLEITTSDGPAYVRLIGLNAPEKGQPGFTQSLTGLQRIIDNADEVSLAVWEPNTYGLKQSTLTKEAGGAIVHRDRLFVWLYVDGVPLFDPDEFSSTNIRGVRTGGNIPDYEALLKRQGR